MANNLCKICEKVTHFSYFTAYTCDTCGHYSFDRGKENDIKQEYIDLIPHTFDHPHIFFNVDQKTIYLVLEPDNFIQAMHPKELTYTNQILTVETAKMWLEKLKSYRGFY